MHQGIRESLEGLLTGAPFILPPILRLRVYISLAFYALDPHLRLFSVNCMPRCHKVERDRTKAHG